MLLIRHCQRSARFAQHDANNILPSRFATSARTSPTPSHHSNSWRVSSPIVSSNCFPPRTSTFTANQWLDASQLGRGSHSRRFSERGKLNEFGHDYAQVGGPVDGTTCDLSPTEIHLLICARMQCRSERDFRRADEFCEEMKRSGVFVNDDTREWRADGIPHFPNFHRIPRMSDCETMEDAIGAIHDNLERASPRDLAEFWTVVPKRLSNHSTSKKQKMVPQMSSILDKTIECLEGAEPRDLAQTAFAFARVMAVLGRKKKRRDRNIYHDFLDDVLVRRRAFLFQWIANASMPILSTFNPWNLSNLVYACALAEHMPKLEDGSALFDHLAERCILLLSKFKPQELSVTLWAFEKAGVLHPTLFEKAADHINSLGHLDHFPPQSLSNIVLSYSKAGVSNPALFGKVADHIVTLEHLGSFKPQELSNTVLAFAKANVLHKGLFDKVADHIISLDHLRAFHPKVISNILLAYAKAGASHAELFAKLADHVVTLDRRSFSPPSVANTTWAFATAEISHPRLFEIVADHVVSLNRLGAFDPQHLSDLTWAFAKAEVPHPGLFEKVADHIAALDSLDEFDEQDINNLVWAFAEAEVSHAGLFEKVADHIDKLEATGALDRRYVGNIVWAFLKMGVGNPQLYDRSKGAAIEMEDELCSG